ncbi:Histone demethylase JHD2 [Nakaseomyces bracarensis]|uniref:Histone demethylase JHD2 n=1 Tax=Nakaseomyces bracarensis TaxID=273131 RepID=A0ABR4NRG6_9SACH
MEVPTVYPNEEEFANPIEYLSHPRIQRLGNRYGMLKLVPPSGFQPSLALNKEKFRFKVRLQHLNELHLLNRARFFFIQNLNNFDKLSKTASRRNNYKNKRRKPYVVLEDSSHKPHHVYLYDFFIYLVKQQGYNLAPASKLLQDNKLWKGFDGVGADDAKQLFKQELQSYYTYLQRILRGHSSPDQLFTGLLYKEIIPNSALQQQEEEDNQNQADDTKYNSTHEEHNLEGVTDVEDSVEDWCPACRKVPEEEELDEVTYCDGCNQIFHNKCLESDDLVKSSHGNFICNNCILGNGFYGFKYSDNYFTLKDFEKLYATDPNPNIDTLEKEFWNLVENIDKTITVPYGADIHSEDPNELTGFPTDDKDYATHPMNLLNLPHAKNSLLPFLQKDISGMTKPWIYVGSKFSTFCWHLEDQYTLSANYQHEGAPKVWYSIPDESCNNFHKLLHDLTPDLFEKQPDLLHQLVSLVSPYDPLFKKYKVKWYKVVQHPNEYVITFPKCYHAGFNSGYNLNEAVNFTNENWLKYGIQAISEYQKTKKMCVFDMYELITDILIMYVKGTITSDISEAFLRYCHEELLTFVNKEGRKIESLLQLTNRVLTVKNDHLQHLDREKPDFSALPKDDEGFFCSVCCTMCSFIFVVHDSNTEKQRASKRRKLSKDTSKVTTVDDLKAILNKNPSLTTLCATHYLENIAPENASDLDQIAYIRDFNELNELLRISGNKLDGIK